jgi:predicted dehydrogenase
MLSASAAARHHGGGAGAAQSPSAKPASAGIDAFADAAEGRAPYPVPQAEMIANIAALEAIFRSAASGRIEAVEA